MKILLSLSGGADSTALLAYALNKGHNVEVVSFNYGSKHNQYENKSMKDICVWYGITPRLIDLTAVFSGFKSSLLKSGGEIPEGDYKEETMSSTVVPCRNIIFASILAGIADSIGAEEIWLGAHGGDHFIYPDCRPDTIDSLNHTISLATEHRVHVKAPFLNLTKSEIINEGFVCNAPFFLTRTCYKDQPIACGKCGSCRERLEAFEMNGLVDPVEYED